MKFSRGQLVPPFDPVASGGVLRHEIREFLAEWYEAHDVRPRIDGWVSGWDPDFSAALATRGWVGMAVPIEFGGGGLSPYERHIVAEELLVAGAPIAFHWFADRQIAPALLKYGSSKQKARYLPAISRGQCSFALGLSEPDAGSDLAAVRTKAERVDGGWKLSGVKIWTSNAHRAGSMTVLARTATSAETPHWKALSQFIVDLPDTKVTVRPITQLGGSHHFNEVYFDDLLVPEESVLGEVGAGWKQVTSELAWERSGPERFLTTYPLFRSLLASTTRDTADSVALGATVSRLWCLHHLSLRVAGALTRGETPTVAAALVKDLGTELEGDIVEIARSLDRPGLSGDFRNLLADATLLSPGFTLRGGSTEVLRGIVARELTA